MIKSTAARAKNTIVGYVIVLALFFALWHAVASYTGILPHPGNSLAYLGSNWETALMDVKVTLENTVAGFAVAAVLALATAWMGTLGGLARSVVSALNVIVQSVSALIWALLFLIIFGFTSRLPAVGVAAATAYPIMLSGALKGFEVAETEYGELARILSMSGLQRLLIILAPASVPFIVASGRAALGAALRISVVAEAFGASGGVGYRLWLFYELHNYEGFTAWALILVALMVFLDRIVLERLEVWSRRWMS